MIHFPHSNQIIPAKVIFNFGQVSDVVLIMPKRIIDGLDEFILFHRMINGKWHTSKPFYESHPTNCEESCTLAAAGFQHCRRKTKNSLSKFWNHFL